MRRGYRRQLDQLASRPTSWPRCRRRQGGILRKALVAVIRPLSPLRCRDLERPEPAAVRSAFNRRFDPHLAALQAQVRGGRDRHALRHCTSSITTPRRPRSTSFRAAAACSRTSPSTISTPPHWLLEDDSSRCSPSASCLVDPAIGELGDVDTAKIVVRSASGVLVRDQQQPTQRLWL